MLPPSQKSEARENKWLKGKSVSQFGIFYFIYEWKRWCSRSWVSPLSKIIELVRNLVRIRTQLLSFLTAASYCSVTQSCLTLWPHGLQHTRLPCSSLSPRVCSNSSAESVMPPNHLILCHPLFLLPSVLPSIRVFSSESALLIRCQSTGVSASASVLPIMNIQGWFPLGWTIWSPCSPGESQESSPTVSYFIPYS